MFSKRSEIDHKRRSALSTFKALLNYARKEEIADRKQQKTKRSYVQERTKQQEQLKSEIVGLNKLLKENSIDEDTYSHLNKMLKIFQEQKLQETRKKYGFTKNYPAMPACVRYVIVRGKPQLRWRDLLTGRFVKQVHNV